MSWVSNAALTAGWVSTTTTAPAVRALVSPSGFVLKGLNIQVGDYNKAVHHHGHFTFLTSHICNYRLEQGSGFYWVVHSQGCEWFGIGIV